MTLTTTTRTRFGAVAVALAPAVMFVALVGHPFIARLPDAAGVANAVEQSTTRWAIIHMLTAVGVGLIALAFLAIRARLRDAGEDRFSVWGLPFVIAGSSIYILLPAMEFAPLSAALTGGDVEAVQTELQLWFIAILATSSILFAVGAVGFARGIAASQILSPGLTRPVFAALIVLAVSRMVPFGDCAVLPAGRRWPRRAVAAGLPHVAGTPAHPGQGRSGRGQRPVSLVPRPCWALL